MKPESNSTTSPAASIPLTGSDPLLELMKAQGTPLTRQNYLALAYPQGAPDPLPAELELGLPPELQELKTI